MKLLTVILFLILSLDWLSACFGGESALSRQASKLLTVAFAAHGTCHQSIQHQSSKQLTRLFMGKGFNRAKNKQAELAKKLDIARKGKENGDQSAKQIESKDDQSKDRELFEKLLTTTKGAIPTALDAESDAFAPIKVGQEKKKKPKKPKPPPQPRVEKEKQAEKIPQRSFFEDLVDVETAKPLGPIDAARLVPWVPPYLTDCLVVFTDPRTNSGDLRQTLKYLTSTLEDQDNEKYNQQVAFVCAESVQEMKSWLQRSNVESSLRIFSDPEMKFMTAYEVVGSDTDYRWSMSMLVFDTDGKKPKLFRDVDPSHASQMALKLMKEYDSKS